MARIIVILEIKVALVFRIPAVERVEEHKLEFCTNHDS